MSARARKQSKAQRDSGDGRKVVTSNRRARYDYQIDKVVEAGIALSGTEIKSIRDGKINLQDAYGVIENDEIWLHGMHIAPYEQASGYYNHDPIRPRKLLLRRGQIDELRREVQQKGYTLIPLRVVLNRGWAKVDLALAKGKRQYDKRDTIAERDAQRRIERALRERR